MAYYTEELEDTEDRENAEVLDHALTLRPPGLADFHPRPSFGSDPSQVGWPPTLVIELALGIDTPKEICGTYGISSADWDLLRTNPAFVNDLRRAYDEVKAEGGSFKVRARLQAGEMLKESWKLAHDPAVPAAVRADIIKSTVKWAGLDASKDQGQNKPGGGVAFNIQLNLG